jgi:hypothetical protein
MSQSLTLPDELFDRLRRAADQQGLSVEQLLAWLMSAAGPSAAMPPHSVEDEDLLVACTRALLDDTDPPVAADWKEIEGALSHSQPAYASIEEAMSALRRRPWAKDE